MLRRTINIASYCFKLVSHSRTVFICLDLHFKKALCLVMRSVMILGWIMEVFIPQVDTIRSAACAEMCLMPEIQTLETLKN